MADARRRDHADHPARHRDSSAGAARATEEFPHGFVALTLLLTSDAGWYVQPDRDSAATV